MDSDNDYRIHGLVTDANGKGVSGASITVWWQRIRERVRLAQDRTSEQGNYELRYRLPEDAPGKVLVVVEAQGGGLTAPLESAQTVAAPDLSINLNAPPVDASQYGTLLRSVTPLLQGLSLTDLVENDAHQDISFLATETGSAKERIMRLVVAAHLQKTFAVTAPAWYAFLALRVPASLPASLLDASQQFTLIDALVAQVAALIAAVDSAQQTSTLQNAVTANVVPESLSTQIAQIVAGLQALRQSNLLGNPYQAGKTTLGQLLNTAGVTPDKQNAFAQALMQNTQPLEQFWATLADGRHGFTPAEVAAVRQTLSIGAFVKNSLPLVSNLQQSFNAGTHKVLSDLAKLSRNDWLNLINSSGAGAVPSNIAGADPAATFAHEIYDRVTASYPTAALSARVASFVPAAQQAPLNTFFANNSSLDLRRENLAIFLKQAGAAAFNGIAAGDKDAVLANANAMQRVLRIVPHVDMAQSLLTAGLTSAASIAMMGKQQFVAKMVGAGAAATDAYKTYALARTRYAGVVALYTQFNSSFAGLWPKALGPREPDSGMVAGAIAQNASLATLFGSQDYCAVDDCTSILSAAAYLTDLLMWLSRRTNGVTGYPNALAVLTARRPDLVNLLLNCPNTDTTLPFIDVVNELLADTISPPLPAAWRQTTISADFLRAAPDPANANPAADALLVGAGAVYPRTLPYDVSLDLLRSVLANANVALWQLRQAFLPLHGVPTVAQLAPVASERFSISQPERNLITTANFAPLPQVWNTANPPVDLAPVSAFLSAANLTYEQLLDLIEVAWVTGGGPAMAITGQDDTCNTATQTLAPLNAGDLDLIHRFLRLWARTGWKMWELDLLLNAAGIGDPTLAPQTLINLFTVRQLLDATGLSVVQLLPLCGAINLDIASHRDPDGTRTTPFYDSLFLNPTLTPDWALLPANLNGTADLATHAPAIQAALQLSAADTATLLALTDNTRTLGNLSLIYRVATLAQVLRLNLSGLQTIGPANLSTIFASPSSTLAFVKRANTIASSGFSLDQTTYVLTTSPAKTGIADAQVAADLDVVVLAMQKVAQSVYGAGDPPYTALSKQFAQLPPSTDPNHPSLSDPNQMKIALSIVDGSYTGSDVARQSFINTQFAFFMNAAQLAAAVAGLPILVSAATGPALDARGNLVLTPLAQYLTQKQVVAAIASSLSLAPDTTSYLMSALVVPQVPASTETLLAALTDPGLLESAALVGSYNTGLATNYLSGSATQVVTLNLASGMQQVSITGTAAGISAQNAIGQINAAFGGFGVTASIDSGTGFVAFTANVGFTVKAAAASAGQGIFNANDAGENTFLYRVSGETTTSGLANQPLAVYGALSGAQIEALTFTAGGQSVTVNLNAGNGAAVGQAQTALNAKLATLAIQAVLNEAGTGLNFYSANPFTAGASASGAALGVFGAASPGFSGEPAVTLPVVVAGSNAIRLLHKVSIVVAQLHLVAADVQWLVPNFAVYGGVDLAHLPVVAGQASQTIDRLLATVLLVQLNRTFTSLLNTTQSPPPAITSLTGLLSAVASNSIATDAAAQAAFAGISGALPSDVQALASAIGISLAAGDWTNPATYNRLRTLLKMAAATNGSGAALDLWSAEAVPATLAAIAAVAALKGATPSSNWLSVAQSLNDPLRENRRDALVAYLTAQRNTGVIPWAPMPWGTDTNSLFDYFLIDTQTSSCMDTSRVVQAYATVQLFVERCLMNLEPNIDTTKDGSWNSDWSWMERYRLWQANREIFLWPENWLVEADRPNISEIFNSLIQEARQTNGTADALETVVLNYIQRLDEIAHLRVCGMCQDTVTATTHVIARTHSDPPVYYHRTYSTGAWTPWVKIPLNIKSHDAVPVVHRRCLYLFWAEVVVANEPQQTIPPAQGSSSPSNSSPPARHVEIRIASSSWRNDKWTPAAYAGGTLYDAPFILLDPQANATTRVIEALYSIKVNLPTSVNRTDLWIDVFRFNNYTFNYEWEVSSTSGQSPSEPEIYQQLVGIVFQALGQNFQTLVNDGSFYDDSWVSGNGYSGHFNLNVQIHNTALHIGRAVFDGRFDALEMLSAGAILQGLFINDYLAYAQSHYGHDAEKLTQLSGSDSDLNGDSSLLPKGGALVTQPIPSGSSTALPLSFTTTVSPNEQNVGPLLMTAQAPFAVIGPATDLQFDPGNDFVYTDPKRAYFVEVARWYEYGSQWRPIPPSNPADVPFQLRYTFHRFYHPYTALFWHEIFNGGLSSLYTPALQASPSTVDPSQGDNFSFQQTYQPMVGRVHWGEDNEIIDFSRIAPYSCYNWELFFHVPFYISQALAQNQQFDDAIAWLEYIFNPTVPVPTPWVTLPFSTLTTAQVAQQNINNILTLVNQNNTDAVNQVARWQNNPFNPFLVADLRPVAYMKAAVIAYVNTLIAQAQNLFATASRENLSEASLLLVRASEIMGPLPQAVPPPARADASFATLQPDLDAFANAMVAIENLLPAGGSGGDGGGGPLPAPETFYFKIPPNTQLLGIWQTVDSLLYNLRHCLSVTGQPLLLPLFDAPLDPGLLAAAEAAGVDLSSIIGDLSAPLPIYRYDILYGQATKFCDTVRTFGAQLLAALEKKDGDDLALLLPTLQQQLFVQQNQMFQWQVDAANARLSAIGQAISVQNIRNAFYTQHAAQFANSSEQSSIEQQQLVTAGYEVLAVEYVMAGIFYGIPNFLIGASGFGGSPVASAALGGMQLGKAGEAGAKFMTTLATILDRNAKLAKQVGDYQQRQDKWNEQASEAQTEIQRLQFEQTAASLAVQIAQQQQADHQTMIDNLQQQIDFLTNKFTNSDLYDWMANKLSDVYFQCYRMAYAMAKRAERDYQYELALPNASFIQFGYWDSLHKGLLAGEALMTDLERMHASYLDLNVRRYEISRIISMATLPPYKNSPVPPIIQLLQTGACDFELPETLYDNDYPGHYQRQLRRVSLTFVYTAVGKNDNVLCTLTLVQNQVRINTTLNSGGGDPYAENPAGSDPRFAYQYGAVQSVVTSNAQDDPGLFENQIHYQITDPRYLPFEGAGAISDWHLELPQQLPQANQIDIATVSDVLIHVLYTSLDGGPSFQQAAINWVNGQPQYTAPRGSGIKLFSAANDFPAPAPTAANPYPLTPWQTFLATPTGGADQQLTLAISSSKFPIWTRGKKITVTGLTVYAVSWTGQPFTLQPQAPLPGANVNLIAPGLPNLLASGPVALPVGGVLPATWSFKLQISGTGNFQSLTSSQIADVILQLQFTAA